MVCRDWLLRGCDKVLVVLLLAVNDFVKLVVKILKLCRFPHLILEHKLGCLQGAVTTLTKKVEAVVNKCLVEVYAPLPEEISAVTDNFDASVRVVAIKA